MDRDQSLSQREFSSFATRQNSVSSQRRWYDIFARCTKLQFLVYGMAHHRQDRETPWLPPEYESVRPLMDDFTRLHQLMNSNRKDRPFSICHSIGVKSSLNSSLTRALLPTRTVCNVLVGAYIKTFESVLRILHVPSFMAEYERFWEAIPSESAVNEEEEVLACKILLIVSLGACICVGSQGSTDVDELPSNFFGRASSWIAHAQHWVAQKMVTGLLADIDLAQISCLLALTKHTQHSYGLVCHPWYYDLSRLGIWLGLHREPRISFPEMPVGEAEIRRRLWATMLELSLLVCFDKGLPAALTPDSYNCEAPSSIADEDIELGLVAQCLTPSTVLGLLTRTHRIRIQILHLINAPCVSKAYDESHQLATKLNAACCANLDEVRAFSKPEPSEFQVTLLEMFTRPFVLALHAQFAEEPSNKSAYYSRRMRMEISSLLLLPFSTLPVSSTSAQHPISVDTGSTGGEKRTSTGEQAILAALRIHGHGHFALVQRQATASLCLDLVSELEENEFPTLESASRNRLRDALRGAVDIFTRRMKVTEGACSTHELVFFTSAKAYIGALQRKCTPGEAYKAITEAARRALASCCAEMERRSNDCTRWKMFEGLFGL
ncbi:uncharacterized protein GIQ15_01207 [Arthroderma uncinatum]|uniref:uncharacterized protein n=1 Tax=Arthroderma uncinatum TaxID=74035 RepID=UPI00144AE8EB|nr:uncharacterized protein GIQ15_01207 [Arthroderma uncinatum]KAF3491690.1 hypothetical protein GIQ15_01207 [Arthroderma uncinatum]